MFDVQRGDVYLADLGEGVGSEQKGERPVLIVQNNTGNHYSPTITVLPITTKIHKSEGMPTHAVIDDISVLDEKSASMAEQITTISRDKLIRYLGSIPERLMKKQINKTMCIQLGLRAYRSRETKGVLKHERNTRNGFSSRNRRNGY